MVLPSVALLTLMLVFRRARADMIFSGGGEEGGAPRVCLLIYLSIAASSVASSLWLPPPAPEIQHEGRCSGWVFGLSFVVYRRQPDKRQRVVSEVPRGF